MNLERFVGAPNNDETRKSLVEAVKAEMEQLNHITSNRAERRKAGERNKLKLKAKLK